MNLRNIVKKGQGVIDGFSNSFIGIFVMILIVVSILLGLGSLNAPSFFTASSLSANATTALQDNTTQIASNFSQRLPTVGTIFGVVLILSVLVLLVLAAVRMKALANQGSSGGAL